MKKNVLFLLILFCLASTTVLAAQVPTMTRDELKALLGNPDLVLLDVRNGTDWNDSDVKIKGAVRIDNRDLTAAVKNYRRESTFVLYCA